MRAALAEDDRLGGRSAAWRMFRACRTVFHPAGSCQRLAIGRPRALQVSDVSGGIYFTSAAARFRSSPPIGRTGYGLAFLNPTFSFSALSTANTNFFDFTLLLPQDASPTTALFVCASCSARSALRDGFFSCFSVRLKTTTLLHPGRTPVNKTADCACALSTAGFLPKCFRAGDRGRERPVGIALRLLDGLLSKFPPLV